MAKRIVTHARVVAGRVTAVCNPDEWWSPRSTHDVAVDISERVHTYLVRRSTGELVPVETTYDGKLLSAMLRGKDILKYLPPC